MEETTINIIFSMDFGKDLIWYDAKDSDYDRVLAKMIEGDGVVCFKSNSQTEFFVAVKHISILKVTREVSYFDSDPLSDSEK